MLTKLQLDGYFNQAANNDNPKRSKASFSAEDGGSNQFARTNNGSRENKSRPEKFELTDQGSGWLLDGAFRDQVWIFFQITLTDLEYQFDAKGNIAETLNKTMRVFSR